MERQIVIVTGDSQFSDALQRVCSGQGCRVETADTVAAGLEIAAQMPVCVLVADGSIEDTGDGLELAEAIHDQFPAAKCFLIIDEQPVGLSSSAANEPWLRFVRKPIGMLQFAADVVDAISESKG